MIDPSIYATVKVYMTEDGGSLSFLLGERNVLRVEVKGGHSARSGTQGFKMSTKFHIFYFRISCLLSISAADGCSSKSLREYAQDCYFYYSNILQMIEKKKNITRYTAPAGYMNQLCCV
jgi:hypothetical protein